jgi:3-hydroxy-9,10-secoandrosta-1,3,5(10)-triene-9,17-dione monooxygenase reductase component
VSPGNDVSETDVSDVVGVSASRFREVLGHFASGLTVVTAMDADGPVGFTCQAFMSLSLEPPLIALAPGKSSTTWPRIAPVGKFCVNVVSEDQEALARDFAVSGAEKADKFSGVGWTPGPAGAPILEGALAWIGCELVQSHDAGDHELIVAAVTDASVDPSGRPLLFYRGGFGRFES